MAGMQTTLPLFRPQRGIATPLFLLNDVLNPTKPRLPFSTPLHLPVCHHRCKWTVAAGESDRKPPT